MPRQHKVSSPLILWALALCLTWGATPAAILVNADKITYVSYPNLAKEKAEQQAAVDAAIANQDQINKFAEAVRSGTCDGYPISYVTDIFLTLFNVDKEVLDEDYQGVFLIALRETLDECSDECVSVDSVSFESIEDDRRLDETEKEEEQTEGLRELQGDSESHSPSNVRNKKRRGRRRVRLKVRARGRRTRKRNLKKKIGDRRSLQVDKDSSEIFDASSGQCGDLLLEKLSLLSNPFKRIFDCLATVELTLFNPKTCINGEIVTVGRGDDGGN